MNQLVGSKAAQDASNGAYNKRSGQNQVVARPTTVQNTTAGNESSTSQQKSNNDPEHRAADAEENMAIATWVGSIATVFAFVGLLYTIYLTRQQTKELIASNNHLAVANKDARTAHDDDRRPWLSVDIKLSEEGIQKDRSGTSYQLVVFATVKNHGSSPAIKAILKTKILIGGTADEAIKEWKAFTFVAQEFYFTEDDFESYAVFPSEERTFKRIVLVPKDNVERAVKKYLSVRAWLFGLVEYDSTHSGGRHSAFLCQLRLAESAGSGLYVFDIMGGFGGKGLAFDYVSTFAD